MDELFLYALFRNILKRSSIIEGRFHVAQNGGNDLNAGNVEDIVKDTLGGIKTAKKYPIAIMLPPVELVSDYDKNWARFKLQMYFLTTSRNNAGGGIKSPNRFNNTSEHLIRYDWKDMREVAGNFRKIFNSLVRYRGISNQVREVQKSTDVYERITLSGNDALSGVSLAFEVDLFMPCSVSDYDESAVNDIEIPSQNTHQLHKQ